MATRAYRNVQRFCAFPSISRISEHDDYLKLQGPRGLTPMGRSGQAPGAPRPPGNATASLTRKEGDRPHLEPFPSVLPATAGAEASGVAGRAPATRPSPP